MSNPHGPLRGQQRIKLCVQQKLVGQAQLSKGELKVT